MQALNEAFAYCDGVYAALTDVSGLEIVTVTQENGRQNQIPRMTFLIQNYGHNNEHYGNLVTYMRIKSIVPASSEPPASASCPGGASQSGMIEWIVGADRRLTLSKAFER